MTVYTYKYEDSANESMVRIGDDGSVLQFGAVPTNPMYAEFLASGATAEPYVEPPYVEPEPTELELLTTRVSAIESNEIIDDATDTSLLLALANAASRLDALEARVAELEGN